MSFHRADEVVADLTTQAASVEEVDGEKHRVRVRFVDQDDAVAPWADNPGEGGSDNASYDLPSKGDVVYVSMDPVAERLVVVGTQYNDKDPSPVTNPRLMHHSFRDGSIDQHDPDAGRRTINAGKVDLGPDGRVASSGVGHMVQVTFGSSTGLHPIVEGSPAVSVTK